MLQEKKTHPALVNNNVVQPQNQKYPCSGSFSIRSCAGSEKTDGLDLANRITECYSLLKHQQVYAT